MHVPIFPHISLANTMAAVVADFDYQLDINLGVHLLGRVDGVGRGVTRIKTRARPPNQSMRANERGGEPADRCECAIHTTALQRARHQPTLVIKIVVLGNQRCWELLHVRCVFKLKNNPEFILPRAAQTWWMAAGKPCSQLLLEKGEGKELKKFVLLALNVVFKCLTSWKIHSNYCDLFMQQHVFPPNNGNRKDNIYVVINLILFLF